MKKKDQLLNQQILVYAEKNENDFIIELVTRKTNHHLILAKVPPGETLAATVRSVEERMRHTIPEMVCLMRCGFV